MRLTVILGLDHAEPELRKAEAHRLLTELADRINSGEQITVGDTHILNDHNGKRIGVADVFAS